MTSTEQGRTVLLLVRHGETDANVAGTWQGATDNPLNPHGRAQAEALARHVAVHYPNISAVYTSPLRRARETAQIVAHYLGQIPIREDPGLAEYNLGAWEGLTYEELRYEKRLWDRMRTDPHWAPPGGESAYQFATRVLDAFRRIARRHPGETILVVSHGGAIATALALLVDNDGRLWSHYQMANCALSELVFDPTPRLIRFNDTHHLASVGHRGPSRVGNEEPPSGEGPSHA